MTQVTPASIAYVATQVLAFILLSVLFLTTCQVRFALSSSPVFSRTDTTTDSETFYLSILDLFEDPEEQDEVRNLLSWWNRYVSICRNVLMCRVNILSSQIFPTYSTGRRPASQNSALARIKAKRALLRGLGNESSAGGV